MNVFSKIYIVLWLALLAVEIFAATTSYVPMDTISENYWWLQRKFPVVVPVVLTAGLLVLWWHLVLEPGEIK